MTPFQNAGDSHGTPKGNGQQFRTSSFFHSSRNPLCGFARLFLILRAGVHFLHACPHSTEAPVISCRRIQGSPVYPSLPKPAILVGFLQYGLEIQWDEFEKQ